MLRDDQVDVNHRWAVELTELNVHFSERSWLPRLHKSKIFGGSFVHVVRSNDFLEDKILARRYLTEDKTKTTVLSPRLFLHAIALLICLFLSYSNCSYYLASLGHYCIDLIIHAVVTEWPSSRDADWLLPPEPDGLPMYSIRKIS